MVGSKGWWGSRGGKDLGVRGYGVMGSKEW